jgi:vesicle transport through interaction with t-SNAREs protein 1
LLVDDSSSIDDFDIGLPEDQKRRLLDNSDRLERTGNQLQEGYRIAIETEEIGTQVLSNLSNQRETIQRSRNRLRETNADLGRSSRLMNMMIMRGIRDKFALYIIGVVFIVAVTLTIYFSIK